MTRLQETYHRIIFLTHHPPRGGRPMPHARTPDDSRPNSFVRHARTALRTTLEASTAAYRRKDFLRSFHRLSSETINAETIDASRMVLREIERALRAERARAGHWTYDLDRHIGLLVAYRAEQARAERITRDNRVTRRSL
jgi:hypothetical protein